MTKDEIRVHQKQIRDHQTEQVRMTNSHEIHHRLFHTQVYQECKAIFTYVSFRSEVDTKDIIKRAFLDQKKVMVPKVESQTMDFYEIKSLEELTPNKMGILEPRGDFNTCYRPLTLELDQSEKLMLLPGLAFDLSGNRIGYGGGYYDRYLSQYKETNFYKVALAYDFQVMEQVVSQEYDIKADLILTPSSYIDCNVNGFYHS